MKLNYAIPLPLSLYIEMGGWLVVRDLNPEPLKSP